MDCKVVAWLDDKLVSKEVNQARLKVIVSSLVL